MSPILGLGRASNATNATSLAVLFAPAQAGRTTRVALLVAFALVARSVAANLLPGVKQPPQYPIPGRPWLAVSAAPDGTADLYLMKGDAKHLTALGETSWTEESAALSPNRRQVLFPSNRY